VAGSSRVDATAFGVHGALLALVATCTWWRRVPDWLRHWVPVIAIPVLYAESPAIIAAAGHVEMLDPAILKIEHAIFGNPSSDLAQAWPWTTLSELLHACYLSYYAIIVYVPVALFRSRRYTDYSRAVFALLLTFAACFLLYVVIPVEGPRYRGGADAPGGPVRTATLWLLENGSSRGTAFPSSHVAVAVAQTIIAITLLGRRALWLAFVTIGLALGAIYGGFHYAIDAAAGAVLGAITASIGLRLGTRKAAQANATAPT